LQLSFDLFSSPLQHPSYELLVITKYMQASK